MYCIAHFCVLLTSVASVLAAVKDSTTPTTWQNEPVILIQAYTHPLPSTIRTHPTDINKGETQACCMSLMFAPTTLPSIILIESRVVFNFIFYYFFPHLHTAQKQYAITSVASRTFTQVS